MRKYLDIGNGIVIAITGILFLVALFIKGITKDLLLEAGILLVSAKIILSNFNNSLKNKEILKKLGEIENKISKLKKQT